MVYDAASLLPRRGLEGGDGIPELTSGTPLDPAHQRSAVVEARERRGGGVQGVGACAHVACGGGIGVSGGITTTVGALAGNNIGKIRKGSDSPTTVSFHCRDSHNYKLPRLLLGRILGGWRSSKCVSIDVALIEGFVGVGVTVVEACCRDRWVIRGEELGWAALMIRRGQAFLKRGKGPSAPHGHLIGHWSVALAAGVGERRTTINITAMECLLSRECSASSIFFYLHANTHVYRRPYRFLPTSNSIILVILQRQLFPYDVSTSQCQM